MRQYHMLTGRIGFGLWRPEDDFALACALWQNPAVCEYLTSKEYFTEEEIAARLLREDAQQQKHGIQYWPLFSLASGEFLGCCGLCPCEWEPQSIEFGIHLLPMAWGQGIGTEASTAVLEKAKAMGNPMVWAGHHPHNEGSKALLTKLGFQFYKNSFYPPTGLMHPSYTLHF